MPQVIDGAMLEVGADIGAGREPFILDRDTLDTAGMILTPATDALNELTAPGITLELTFGASDFEGPMTVVEAGTLTLEMDDPNRTYDPGNPNLTDPPAIGRAVAVRIDGALVWTGRITRAAHDWAALVSTIEAEDAIAEASRQGVTVDLPAGSTRNQLWALVNAAGWPTARFTIHGELTRDRAAERFTGNLLEGLQRVQTAELGALFSDPTGRLVFRGRGQGPVVTTARATIGLEPYIPVTTIETSTDARFANAVYVEPLAGPVMRYADDQSVSAHGEVALEVAASDLLLT